MLSHIEIIKNAKINNYKKILVLEDDIFFINNFEVYLQHIRQLKDWKLLYFGGTQYEWKDRDYIDNFYYAKKTLGTFAYAIDCSIFDEIIEFNKEKSIDNYLATLQDKYYKQCYVFYPNICIADVSVSSIREFTNSVTFVSSSPPLTKPLIK